MRERFWGKKQSQKVTMTKWKARMEKLKEGKKQECTKMFLKATRFWFIDCNHNQLDCTYPAENNGQAEGEEERKCVSNLSQCV